MADPQINRLVQLIQYVEQTEKDKLKTVLDITDHKGFRLDEAALAGLPGVTLNKVGLDDIIWLNVARLQRTGPPQAGAELACWLDLSNDPGTEPALLTECPARVLIEAGCLSEEDQRSNVALDDYVSGEQVRAAYREYKLGPCPRAHTRRRRIASRRTCRCGSTNHLAPQTRSQ